jgi:hypothetical protein
MFAHGAALITLDMTVNCILLISFRPDIDPFRPTVNSRDKNKEGEERRPSPTYELTPLIITWEDFAYPKLYIMTKIRSEAC